jgi:tRNA pseudouridine38-40 synthase
MGTRFAGFQRQPGKLTVQGELERALMAVTGERTGIVASGRTDAGAHSLGQVVAFSTESALSADTFRRALNAHLPDDITVARTDDAPPGFHPRFAARRRTYRYLVFNRAERSPFYRDRALHIATPLDVSRIEEALQLLVGRRDVSAFVPVQANGNRERYIYAASCRRDGDLVSITLEASGFMRQMVRSIVGTVIRVGRGKLSVSDFAEIMRSGRRELAGDTAPAHGLYLAEVLYDESIDREADRSAPEVGGRARGEKA